MIEKIEKLRHSGDVDGALGKISELLRNDRSTDAIRYAAFFIIDNAVYDRFGEALDLLKEYTTQNTTDSQAFRAMAYTAWVNRNPSLCEEAVKKAININHSDPQSYLILGMSYLTENRIFEALTTLGTGMLFSADRNNFIPWMKLTTLLFKGITSVSVKFDGTTYIMPLSCFNGQAMEASAIYVNGNYCETEELLLIRDKVGPCRNIVEVGCLVGNHTSYFARTLKPESITVFDADQRSLLVTKHTVEVNTSDLAKAPTMSFTHAAIGKTPGTVSFFGEETKMISLDAAITGPVDFMKVDVDGMELEALSGMERVMRELRPKIMIEVQLRLREPFLQMVKNSGYRVQSAIERKIDANFLIVPDRL